MKIYSTKKLAICLMLAVMALLAVTQNVMAELPANAEWAGSGHADATAEAFVHWDEDDPAVVSGSCAKCHSTSGYQDYIGADGTAVGSIENVIPVGEVVDCTACHNDAASAMTSVVFPSGVEITGLGSEARCIQCHSGRESGLSIVAKIEEALEADPALLDDTVSSVLSFKNIHYLAAGATQFGSEVKGGYEYDGKMYDASFKHVAGVGTCVSCHNPHSLEVEIEKCADCHTNVAAAEDLADIRNVGIGIANFSVEDYDGDGDAAEGIANEIADLKVLLYAEIQAYAAANTLPIIYDSHAYPYFFVDSNGNGDIDPGEAIYPNAYKAFTPRLLKAVYNYQVSMKDPGAYAHNGKYMIQILYDTIEDLNPAAVATLTREDGGHFGGASEPFRHWDEDDNIVSGSCSKCHSAKGLPLALDLGVTTSQPASNGLECATCHSSTTDFALREVDEVEMPSGLEVSFGDGKNANLCLNCHQGRQSTVSVRDYIDGKGVTDPDVVSSSLGFRNVHYFPAGGTIFGTEAKAAYEYVGNIYNDRFMHLDGINTCTDCHDAHTLEIKPSVINPDIAFCYNCHSTAGTLHDISGNPFTSDPVIDYDGDGVSGSNPVTGEGIAEEIETMYDLLYTTLQAYSANLGKPMVYDSHSYPYCFNDLNGNGVADPEEVSRSNGFKGFTLRSLKAAYNYQFVTKDPGAFAHNGEYVIQVLYDSLKDLGADVSGMTRPVADEFGPTPQCGDINFPHPVGDFNKDCRVDMADFAVFGGSWLNDMNPPILP